MSFRTQHSGKPIASPAILERIGTAFRRAVRSFAADSKIPVVRFINDDRKIERMRPYLAWQAATSGSSSTGPPCRHPRFTCARGRSLVVPSWPSIHSKPALNIATSCVCY